MNFGNHRLLRRIIIWFSWNFGKGGGKKEIYKLSPNYFPRNKLERWIAESGARNESQSISEKQKKHWWLPFAAKWFLCEYVCCCWQIILFVIGPKACPNATENNEGNKKSSENEENNFFFHWTKRLCENPNDNQKTACTKCAMNFHMECFGIYTHQCWLAGCGVQKYFERLNCVKYL